MGLFVYFLSDLDLNIIIWSLQNNSPSWWIFTKKKWIVGTHDLVNILIAFLLLFFFLPFMVFSYSSFSGGNFSFCCWSSLYWILKWRPAWKKMEEWETLLHSVLSFFHIFCFLFGIHLMVSLFSFWHFLYHLYASSYSFFSLWIFLSFFLLLPTCFFSCFLRSFSLYFPFFFSSSHFFLLFFLRSFSLYFPFFFLLPISLCS